MNWTKWAAIGVLGLVVAAGAFIRFTPVTLDDIPARPVSQPPGDYAESGGFYAVRPAGSINLEQLSKNIEATPRTKPLAGAPDDLPMIFVHRSLVWAFPDVTQVWVEDGNVHIYSHLIYGGADLGVNRNRMQAWLTQ